MNRTYVLVRTEGDGVYERKPIIEVRDLAKVHGASRARGGITYDVATGELSGPLGSSGAGKVATLRILSALLGGTTSQAGSMAARRRPSRRGR